MSWSVSTTFPIEPGEAGKESALDAINALQPTGQDYAHGEKAEQCAAAKRAAFAILVEGGFENAEEIGVSLSGHANEGHASSGGMANDSITVNVYIKKYRESQG